MTSVLVIGGGIAAAAAAIALRKAGLTATVYEAYPAGADDVGAFLTIMNNGQDALRAIDAHQPLLDRSFPAVSTELFNSTGQRLATRPFRDDADSFLPRTLTRAALYRVLHDEASRRGVRIEHGRRLVDASKAGERVIASFEDGTHAEGDLLVGADGIHSVTRSIIDPTGAPEPRYAGLNVVYGYTAGTPVDPAHDVYRMIFGGQSFFGYTTAPDDTTWWFARLPGAELTPAEIAEATPDDWKRRTVECFADDDTPAADIIRATGENITGNSSYEVPSTPVWHTATMVLAGDAAHAASPAAGQGASMALEDGVILARCLRDLPSPEQAFRTYERLRRQRVEHMVAASAQRGTQAEQGPAQGSSRPADWLSRHHIDWSAPVVPD